MEIEIVDDPDEGRYEARVDGEVVGVAVRSVREGTMVLPHTEVRPSWRGRGVAAALVRRALDDARAQGLAVVPRCSFVARYVADHPDVHDLVAAH